MVRAQRRLKARDVAIVAVLDERCALPDPTPDMTARAVHETLDVARSIGSLPAIAEAAPTRELSWDQLKNVVEGATPATDAEWAERAPNCAPVDPAGSAWSTSMPRPAPMPGPARRPKPRSTDSRSG